MNTQTRYNHVVITQYKLTFHPVRRFRKQTSRNLHRAIEIGVQQPSAVFFRIYAGDAVSRNDAVTFYLETRAVGVRLHHIEGIAVADNKSYYATVVHGAKVFAANGKLCVATERKTDKPVFFQHFYRRYRLLQVILAEFVPTEEYKQHRKRHNPHHDFANQCSVNIRSIVECDVVQRNPVLPIGIEITLAVQRKID